MKDYQLLVKQVFSNKQGQELLEFWITHEIMTPVNPDISDGELRSQMGKRNFITEIINILSVEDKK